MKIINRMPVKEVAKDQIFPYEFFHFEYENIDSVASHASHLEAMKFSTIIYSLPKYSGKVTELLIHHQKSETVRK